MFTADPVCEGESTDFINNSTPGVDTGIAQYNWTFNDIPIANATTFTTNPNTTHPFSGPNFTPGYNVSLEAVDSNNCKATFSGFVQVSNNPEAIIEFDSLTLNSTSNFTACKDETIFISSLLSNYIDYGSQSVFWDVVSGPPNSWVILDPSAPTTQITFTSAGSYVLRLEITDQNNCPGFEEVIIDVWDNPSPTIDPIQTVCQGDPTILSHITSSSVAIEKYEWNFGNGDPNQTIYNSVSSPNSGNTSKEYACNNYDVTLEVTDANGCIGVSSPVNATINCLPTANFNASEECFGFPTSFDAVTPPFNSIPAPGGSSITTWVWELNDPVQGIVTTPTAVGNHTWPFGGPISQNTPPHDSVTLTVYDNQSPSCQAQTTKPIVVHELPNVYFTAPEFVKVLQLN